MQITEATVRHVAKLASLALTEDEVTRFTQELSGILDFVDQLNQLDLSSVTEGQETVVTEPVLADSTERFRPDEGLRRFERDALLKNAPEEEDGFFRVPQILDAE